jgi:hypothetical protein
MTPMLARPATAGQATFEPEDDPEDDDEPDDEDELDDDPDLDEEDDAEDAGVLAVSLDFLSAGLSPEVSEPLDVLFSLESGLDPLAGLLWSGPLRLSVR